MILQPELIYDSQLFTESSESKIVAMNLSWTYNKDIVNYCIVQNGVVSVNIHNC